VLLHCRIEAFPFSICHDRFSIHECGRQIIKTDKLFLNNS
jgi:hypothetical protein